MKTLLSSDFHVKFENSSASTDFEPLGEELGEAVGEALPPGVGAAVGVSLGSIVGEGLTTDVIGVKIWTGTSVGIALGSEHNKPQHESCDTSQGLLHKLCAILETHLLREGPHSSKRNTAH